jgi:hypothetical protein
LATEPDETLPLLPPADLNEVAIALTLAGAGVEGTRK